jgi:hypothetical protein
LYKQYILQGCVEQDPRFDITGPQLILPPTALYSIPVAIIVQVLLFSGDHGDRKGQRDNGNWGM